MLDDGIKCATGGAQKEKTLRQLQGVIHGAIDRYREAINRYRVMNDGLTGCEPEEATNDAPESIPNGLIYEVIEDAEKLRQLCNRFDNENSRLNKVIIDGQKGLKWHNENK